MLLLRKPAHSVSLAPYSEFINTINPLPLYNVIGGSVISLQETAKETAGFICPNASCGKVFVKPLKAVKVGISPEPYDACPFCLTEIPRDAHRIKGTLKEEIAHQTNTQKLTESSSITSECKNRFGYLSQKAVKEKIPDECLTCRAIIQCMLKPYEKTPHNG